MGGSWKRILTAAVGWLAFGLGWVGVFLPGLPTTIFWIIAAAVFVRSNRRMYDRIIRHPRFGETVRLFVEQGRISRRGKAISISAMLLGAGIGAVAIARPWVKLVVLGAALAGSAWVAVLPTRESGEAKPRHRLPTGAR